METVLTHVPGRLPPKDPLQACIPQIRGGQLGAVYYGQRLKGDFYDFVRANSDRVLFGLFDVAGGLEQTRPVMLALQESFRRVGTQLFGAGGGNEAEGILELWIELNRSIMKAAGGVHSCPAFLGCYNEELHALSYVNAGHTPGFVRDHTEVAELKATALPLGLFSHSVPDSCLIAIAPGDGLLLVSKGVVEAKRKREEFGVEGVKQYLEEIRFETAHETCVGLLSRIRQFMGTVPTHNDVTAVCLMRSLDRR